MNPEDTLTPREQLEVRVTALLMGELPADEAAELRRRIAEDPQLAALHARLQIAVELLREASAARPQEPAVGAPARLSEERRQRLLAHFKMAPFPAQPAARRTNWKWIAQIGIAAALTLLAGISLLPPYEHYHQMERPDFIPEDESALMAATEGVDGSHDFDKSPAPPESPTFAAPLVTDARSWPKQMAGRVGGSARSVTVPAAPALEPAPRAAEAKPASGPQNEGASQAGATLPDGSARGFALKRTPSVGDEAGRALAPLPPAEPQSAEPALAQKSGILPPLQRESAVGQPAAPVAGMAGGMIAQNGGAPAAGTLFANSVSETAPPAKLAAASKPAARAKAAPVDRFDERVAEDELRSGVELKNESVLSLQTAPRGRADAETAAKMSADKNLAEVSKAGSDTTALSGANASADARVHFGTITDRGTKDAEKSTEAIASELEKLKMAAPVDAASASAGNGAELAHRGDVALQSQNVQTRYFFSQGNRPAQQAQLGAAASDALSVIEEDAIVLGKKVAPSAEPKPTAGREMLGRSELSDAPARPQAPPPVVPQPEIQTADNAVSTFSLNVSDVSFKLADASLQQGKMPEPSSVRSEEFINAFDYRDPEPTAGGAPIAFASERARYPFAQNRDLLRLSVKTAAAGRQPGRALNLVLVLDNSGSMERADRVRILHEALTVLAKQLQQQDRLSVITFSRTPRLWTDGVSGDQALQAVARVAEITPQGGTNLSEALELGYKTALRHFQANNINRVVLMTDGAANLGDVNPEAMKQKVEAYRKQGVALDCFGVGWEGYDDEVLETLSRNGDGRYGFLNSPEEAASEFAGQLAGALRVAASDVKVQVEFNPRRVTAYRQVGYAKHQLTKEQFRDNTVDAAEIGAAEAGNALYVVEVNPRGDGDLGTVRVRFKVPGADDYREHEWTIPFTAEAAPIEQASPALRLAAAAGAFSEQLAANPYAGEVTSDRLLGILNGVPKIYRPDPRPKRLEWMIRQAKSVSGK